MAVYESLRDAECFAIFRVRRHMRRVWLGTCNREDAEEMEKAEIAVARVTNCKPTKGNRGRTASAPEVEEPLSAECLSIDVRKDEVEQRPPEM